MNRKDPLVVRWTIGFVRWFCPPLLVEGIEGDLLEEFDNDVQKNGKGAAGRRLIWNALKFFRLSIIMRNRLRYKNNSLTMLKSYFKITLRNIARSKGYSFINIFGLSLGIACCLLTANYVAFEFSFDNFHPNVERTYRVGMTMIWDVEGGEFGSTSPPVPLLLAHDYPEVEEVTRIHTPGNFIVRYTGENGDVRAFNETYIFSADSNVFNFFGFKIKEGDPSTALKGINKAVISSVTAQRLFGNEPALGKIILFGNDRIPVEITGVAEVPDNTHFKFNYLLSMPTTPHVKRNENNWIWTQVVTYVRLAPGASAEDLRNKMGRITDTVIGPWFTRVGMSYDDLVTKEKWQFYMMPIRDIHLKSRDNRLGTVGDVRYAYAFGAIGLFVLVIAAINFVNLSTARGAKRAREVGVKKVLGAMRSSLISQFQAESILLALFSIVLAIPLVELLRFLIEKVLQNNMPFMLWDKPIFLLALPVLGVVIGFLAGLYPSFYLTSFLPAQVLKGKIATGMGSSRLRGTLVVAQFAISITLIIGTVIVLQQINFLRSTNLGFDKENILSINLAEKLGDHLESFRNEVLSLPGVVGAAVAMDTPRGGGYEDIFSAEGSTIKLPITAIKIDDHYFETMGFDLVAGRTFDYEHNASDNAGVIVNERMCSLFGWTSEEAIGKIVLYSAAENTPFKVIGVVKDFHFKSLREAIAPMFFSHITSNTWGEMRVLTVRYRTDDLPNLIREIERRWNAIVDQAPMGFSFLDEDIAAAYDEDQRLGDIFQIFTTLSVIISLIGLVGLVSYSAEVRKKEIGIRKVLGASRSAIVVMMNSSYLKLIAIGLVIATPLAWYAMRYWLETFEFRIDISPLVFVFAGFAVMAGALISVAYLSLRAASVNPASVLKEE
jgi:putative ABC transport system permease protein